MSNPLPLDEAVPRLRSLLAAQAATAGDPLSAALRAFTEFARVEFSVPVGSDTDGCLVEYGVNSLSGEPLFVINLTRQFENVDSSGEHESYTQVSCEVKYQVTGDLEVLGDFEDWWFRGGQESDFSSWWQSLPLETVIRALGDRAPAAVVVDSDVA
ncbi:hypothetical protein ACFWY6_12850 [Streptomyces sp. NPDC059037]|uniref:hypothetical protein n=1 Tax=Streptomyces sp. NPDC059037 TaxID=3346710 RepID=UPI00369A61E4